MCFHRRGRRGKRHLQRLFPAETVALPFSFTAPLVKMGFRKGCGCAAMKAPVGLSSSGVVCVSRWRGFAPPNSAGVSESRNLKYSFRCNDDDRRQWRKQGGVVGTAASKTRVPSKARCGCWVPQPGRRGGHSKSFCHCRAAANIIYKNRSSWMRLSSSKSCNRWARRFAPGAALG